MTKVNQNTALEAINKQLPQMAGDAMVQVSAPDSKLPTLKVVYPIEIGSNGIENKHSFTFGASTGDAFSSFPAGTILTVIAGRDAVRRLMVEVDGEKIPHDPKNGAHKKLEASYEKGYKEYNGLDKSHDTFLQGLREGWQKGAVYLVAAMVPKEGCMIAELPAFKTASSYWHRALKQAPLNPLKLGLQIMIDDHSVNLKKSKSSNNKYLDGSKFNQYKIIELEKKHIDEILGAIEKAKADIDQWFDR